jgi:hypothetical protein
MCLTIAIRSRSQGVPRAAGAVDPLLVPARRGSSIHGCELLADEADWNATWSLTFEGRQRLGAAVAAGGDALGKSSKVEAVCDGDHPEIDETMTGDEMLSLVAENTLGNKTQYMVLGTGR